MTLIKFYIADKTTYGLLKVYFQKFGPLIGKKIKDLLRPYIFNRYMFKLPDYFLFFLILYDSIFHDFIFIKIFYYLPFYMIYKTFHGISYFTGNTDEPLLNVMIFEMYYQEDFTRFFDIEEEECRFFLGYLKSGLVHSYYRYLARDNDKYLELTYLKFAIVHTIHSETRYLRDSLKPNIFEWPYHGEFDITKEQDAQRQFKLSEIGRSYYL